MREQIKSLLKGDDLTFGSLQPWDTSGPQTAENGAEGETKKISLFTWDAEYVGHRAVKHVEHTVCRKSLVFYIREKRLKQDQLVVYRQMLDSQSDAKAKG